MGVQLQVDSIAKSYQSPIKDDALINYRRMDDGFFLSELKPIHITKEILEKNGFELSNDFCYECWQNQDGRVTVSNFTNTNGRSWNVHIDNEDFDTMGEIEIEHVHELQHMLRLCGIDKEIVL